MNKDILNFIGLMNRAGALITGTDLVLNGIRSGKVKMVLIDALVSDNTFKKITDKCKYYNVSYLKVPTDAGLGLAIGNSNRMVIGITDQNFVKALKEKLDKEEIGGLLNEST